MMVFISFTRLLHDEKVNSARKSYKRFHYSLIFLWEYVRERLEGLVIPFQFEYSQSRKKVSAFTYSRSYLHLATNI